ncbi:MAG: replication-associated recombination protein A [Bacilli bacterium]|nr:replication-associated recombination protein A [Bacilli bacterium]
MTKKIINEPFANYFRPLSFNDIVGQKHLFSNNNIFLKTINNQEIPNLIFYGPPGTGKTSVAEIIAKKSNKKIFKLNCTTAKTNDISKIIKSLDTDKNKKILLYLDEIQYFNKKQQQTILEFIENGKITLIASTTENPYFYIYNGLLSRSMVFEFKLLRKEDIKKRLDFIIKILEIDIDADAIDFLSVASNGDMRKAINFIEFIYKSDEKKIDLENCQKIIDKNYANFYKNGDIFYDLLSGLHKSIRGSDVNAALFYLAKLLDNGNLISACRRLLCVANEDIGLANPQVIALTKAAVDSALMLGMPEGRLPLSNITILLASSPKSNSALSIDMALKDVREGKGKKFPRAIQNWHFNGDDDAKKQNYKYPHNYENHYVQQQYMPDDLKDVVYYRRDINNNKIENKYADYLNKIKKTKNKS